MTAYDLVMRHGWRIAFAAGTAAVLVAVGLVPLTWGGTPHMTFYRLADVKLAASSAGLRIAGISAFPVPRDRPSGEGVPRGYIFRDRGNIRRGQTLTPLFLIYVIERQPYLDSTWNRRTLRNAIKNWKWHAVHYPKQFHVRRANVLVVGLRGLSPELREQLVRTLRSLPDHGDSTVIGASD